MGGQISDPVMAVCHGVSCLSGRRLPRVCIETGTYRGESTCRFSQQFDEVHTIELSEQWYEYSKERLANCANVKCYKGNSVEVLKQLLQSLDEPAMFFLDAHYAGGTTAHGVEEVPLLSELEIICRRSLQDIIVIDDARFIGKAGKCGYSGDSVYPLMNYDWRNVTYGQIRDLTGKGLTNTWISWWDKIIVLRNQTTKQGIAAALAAIPCNICDIPMRFGKRVVRRVIGG